MFFKNPSFSCEEEYKLGYIIIRDPNDEYSTFTSSSFKTQEKVGIRSEYVDINFDLGIIKEIKLSALCKDESRKQVEDILQNLNLDNIKITESKIPLRF